MATIETITKRVEPMMGEEFDIALSYPTSLNQAKRSPITCFVSKNGSNEEFGAYIYSIMNPKTLEVYQTVLSNSNEALLDLTKRLSLLITKKYKVPSYVAISGGIQLDESVIYIKEIIKVIDTTLESKSV